ncbi:hypothetical protein [Hymenobacter negativus]|uniref:Uncharacterized protein n=1 Tax=Hymenobacter negativus TaxID=2795026 RepID=A0ABS3QHZ8_9BACT|nr:hypothetical protein [Hymenobacter negativus]MBO2010864.1 hypothetical protein [Hymenobacter negativus]
MPKKLTQAEFIAKAQAVHGLSKYDYSETVYQGSMQKVKIICPEHGAFEQTPNGHTNGKGCHLCARKHVVQKQTKGLAYFLTKAEAAHGAGVYDYSQVVCAGASQQVKIICPQHGPFNQTLGSHARGHGCPRCGKVERARKAVRDTSEFIAKAQAVHGASRYDYSQTMYSGVNFKVSIRCTSHGVFTQKAKSHLRGDGCAKCGAALRGQSQRLNTDFFIERARATHGDLYDYSLAKYTTSKDRVTIICSVHGTFEQLPYTHILGFGCSKCGFELSANASRYNTKMFIDKAREVHEGKYDYSKSAYVSSQVKLKIICPEHGEFEQVPGNHLQGSGCNKCVRNEWDEVSFLDKCRELWPLFDFSKTKYSGLSNKVVFSCPLHGEVENYAGGLLFSQRGCADCGKSRQPGWSRAAWVSAQQGRVPTLYLVRMWKGEEAFYKVGITYTSVATRFKKIPYNVQLLALYSGNEPGSVYDLEKSIKRQCKDSRYMPKELFGGRHECYSESSQVLPLLPLSTEVFSVPLPVRIML